LIVERLEVEGGFMDGLDLQLSTGLNVLVGARGTGKTTVIELIRFCTDAPSLADRFGKRAREHVLSILQDGKVRLTVLVDGERQVLERTRREEPVGLSARLPIVLSQNEVEVVGVDERGRLRLIDDFRHPNAERETRARAAMSAVKSLARELTELDSEIRVLRGEVEDLERVRQNRVAAEREAEAGRESVEQASVLFEELDIIGQQLADQAARVTLLKRARDLFVDWRERILQAERQAPRLGEWPGATASNPLSQVESLASAAQRDLGSAADRAQDALETLDEMLSHERQNVATVDDRARSLRAQADLLQSGAGAAARRVSEMREREAQLTQLARVLDERVVRREEAREHRDAQLAELERLRDDRFRERADLERQLNALLNPRIRISLRKGGLFTPYADAIAEALRGSGLHYAQLAPFLAQRVAPSELASAVERRDADWLRRVGEISQDRAERLLAHLASHGVGEILTAPIDDGVILELLDGDRYKETPLLSTGQRCTAVLPILLQHHDRPVVLDQPEDHLDTAFIVDALVQGILARSDGSQLIVSTHNANIPVLGDDGQGALLDGDVALDVVGRDPVERAVAEERHDVVSQVRGDGQPVRLLAAFELKSAAQLGAGLFHGHPPAARDPPRGFDLAELRSAFSACALVSPSLRPSVRAAPILRCTRRPSVAYHDASHAPRTTRNVPVP
jgi:hypothetical protein